VVPRHAAALRSSRGLACVLAATLSACASPLQVRSLATERSDQQAYELSGSEPQVLRQEALRLCPQGAEILRQAAQERRPEPSDVAWRQGLRTASEWFDPPSQSAQLVVLCQASPGGLMLSAARPAAPAASGGVASATPQAALQATPQAIPQAAAAPIGPVTVEW
jgi:hypothetical protein